jgi:hypothetical protein
MTAKKLHHPLEFFVALRRDPDPLHRQSVTAGGR